MISSSYHIKKERSQHSQEVILLILLLFFCQKNLKLISRESTQYNIKLKVKLLSHSLQHMHV